MAVTGSALSDMKADIATYNPGIGRRFGKIWSGAIIAGYEPRTGKVYSTGRGDIGNLGPKDGYRSIGVAATYTFGNAEIRGGVRYIDIGDAVTTIGADFSGNSAVAAGIRLGYHF